MTKPLRVGLICLCAFALGNLASGQAEDKPQSPAQLELIMKVAATSDKGYPTALRITIKNVGGVPVDMPILSDGCYPNNGLKLGWYWTSSDPEDKTGHGHGYGCGGGGSHNSPKLIDRVKNDWVRLRPGEYMTATENLESRTGKYAGFKPGTIKYWAEYTPPASTAQEFYELEQAGYIIPTEYLKTDDQYFEIR